MAFKMKGFSGFKQIKRGAFKQNGRVPGSQKEPRITAAQGRSLNSYEQLLKQMELKNKALANKK